MPAVSDAADPVKAATLPASAIEAPAARYETVLSIRAAERVLRACGWTKRQAAGDAASLARQLNEGPSWTSPT